MRDFLTPALWKQALRALGPRRRPLRWSLQTLVLVTLTMTWCCGDSQAERFEAARAFCVVCRSKRRRPGHTTQGWQKALARLPAAVLRTLAAGVRQRLGPWLQKHGRVEGFLPIGCDGSRLECPRTAELEQRLGKAGKKDSAPMLWVTALVHLRSGLLWSWRLGKGTASERSHLRQLLGTLPAETLLIADAGYVGYDLAQDLVANGAQFLIRMSCQATLYTLRQQVGERFRDGTVYYWPEKAQNQQRPALAVRLLRVRGRQRKTDVWLLTNVCADRLPAALASQFYRWRWENEGFFRTYKRTLKMVKLSSRTVRLVHREAEGALLGAQLLLAQGAEALVGRRTPSGAAAVVSPRKVLLAIRAEIAAAPRRPGRYEDRLARAQRERRRRRSSKVKREWPRRSPHKPPKPPRLLQVTKGQKARILQQIREKG